MLEAIPTWIADHNAVEPHPALGFRSPQQYRAEIGISAPTEGLV